MIPITLKTNRLILRRANIHDAVTLFNNYLSVKESSRFLTRTPYIHLEQAESFLNEWCNDPWGIERNKFAWVIATLDKNEAIGVFLVEQEDKSTLQIHYGISKLYENQGLVTEAGEAVVNWLCVQSEIEKIVALCDLENVGSAAVLKKLGFKNQGILRDKLTLPAFGLKPRDCYYCLNARNI